MNQEWSDGSSFEWIMQGVDWFVLAMKISLTDLFGPFANSSDLNRSCSREQFINHRSKASVISVIIEFLVFDT